MNKVLMFALGAAVGSLITWKLLEKKYKDLADEEIESVIERFNNREKEERHIINNFEHIVTYNDAPNEDLTKPNKEEKEDYHKMVQDLEYDYSYDYSDDPDITITKMDDGSIWMGPTPDRIEPYIINPDEFGDNDDYSTKTWMYYADFTVTDEEGEIVSDAQNHIGDALTDLIQSGDNSIYVRNDNNKCDYEIIKSDMRYSDAYYEEDN